jgi:hypothetical protein
MYTNKYYSHNITTKDVEELHNDKKSKSQKHIVSKLNSKSTLLLNLAEKKERIL